MTKTTVFQFTRYNGKTDEVELKAPWATREAIETRKGTIVEKSAREVLASEVDEDGFLIERKK